MIKNCFYVEGIMNKFIEAIEKVNSAVNNFVWGPPVLALLLITGIYITIRTGFFQVRKFPHILSKTILAIFKDKKVTKSSDNKSISQFQALSTALAATVGTGNVVGVATAIVAGGPGAVFWMWISAFFGMMTKFSEIVLGIFFRKKDEEGEWQGGPMMYLQNGLKAKWLAVLFAIFCLAASFGIGNIAQINSISTALNESLNVPTYITGIILALIVAFIVIGGLKRIANVTEKLVPFMAILYIVGAITLIIVNFKSIPDAFVMIFKGAFSLEAVGGGVLGFVMAQAMRYGIARGVFSNEAGLGSAVIVHTTSDVNEPVKQGLWGSFEVFVDTIVICTLTALVVLTSGVPIDGSLEGSQITMAAFEQNFGIVGAIFMTVAIFLFAFSTVLGWSFYGEKALEYLAGKKVIIYYKILFVIVTFIGANSSVKLVWDLSDTFNGLMAIPNLIALLLLSPIIIKIVKNYSERTFCGKDVKPLVSYYDDNE